MPTRYAGHAEKIAYKFAKANKNSLIISASGDGGYNEVINGAARAQLGGAASKKVEEAKDKASKVGDTAGDKAAEIKASAPNQEKIPNTGSPSVEVKRTTETEIKTP